MTPREEAEIILLVGAASEYPRYIIIIGAYIGASTAGLDLAHHLWEVADSLIGFDSPGALNASWPEIYLRAYEHLTGKAP